jgi:UDP-N-acetylglucosamine 2-epimerase (non-hydrolysing)
LRIVGVVGARPNFMKIEPIFRLLDARGVPAKLVHTGQHYDENLSRVFFADLGLREPDIELNVGSGTHAEQTAKVMLRLEPILQEDRPDLLLVVGDVNSTLAASVTAAKLDIPIAHVEAGLRSFDRAMPEEINRIVTDALSSLLFTTAREADENLAREGVPRERIFFVGNVMIDTLERCRKAAARSEALSRLGLEPREYVLVTLHRAANVDSDGVLADILSALGEIQQRARVVFAVHPRTRARIHQFGYEGRLSAMGNLLLTDPLGYVEFLALESQARLVLTDSGGVQEETTVLGVPCLTLRENTERPITVSQGTNRLVGRDRGKIVAAALAALDGRMPSGRIPELWDGKAAERIVEILCCRR